MAGIEDVAKAAGVSKALVSRYLNNKPGVGENNKRKIAEEIRRLHYRRNDIARSLVKQRTGAVGVILDSLCDTFVFDLIRGLETGARENGYKVVFCDCREDPKAKLEYIEYLSHSRVDGLVLYGSFLTDNVLAGELSRSGFPFVLIENDVPGVTANKVLIDNFGGAKRAVRHLFLRGCRDIRMVCWGMSTYAGKQRCEGFKAGLAACGLPLGTESVYFETEGLDPTEPHGIMDRLIDGGNLPDGIFFGADVLAFSAIKTCLRRGVKIPDDLAVVGFDNDRYTGGDLLMPKLTTLAQPLGEVGRTALCLLADALKHPDKPCETRMYTAELIKGDTA